MGLNLALTCMCVLTVRPHSVGIVRDMARTAADVAAAGSRASTTDAPVAAFVTALASDTMALRWLWPITCTNPGAVDGAGGDCELRVSQVVGAPTSAEPSLFVGGYFSGAVQFGLPWLEHSQAAASSKPGIATTDGFVARLDAATGALQWLYTVQAAATPGASVVRGAAVMALAYDMRGDRLSMVGQGDGAQAWFPSKAALAAGEHDGLTCDSAATEGGESVTGGTFFALLHPETAQVRCGVTLSTI